MRSSGKGKDRSDTLQIIWPSILHVIWPTARRGGAKALVIGTAQPQTYVQGAK